VVKFMYSLPNTYIHRVPMTSLRCVAHILRCRSHS